MKRNRYYLDTDCSGHWYIIPVVRYDEFVKWVESEEPNTPEYAIAVNGSPTRVTFENPKIAE